MVDFPVAGSPPTPTSTGDASRSWCRGNQVSLRFASPRHAPERRQAQRNFGSTTLGGAQRSRRRRLGWLPHRAAAQPQTVAGSGGQWTRLDLAPRRTVFGTVLRKVATQTRGAFQRVQTSLVTSRWARPDNSTEVEGPKGEHRRENSEPAREFAPPASAPRGGGGNAGSRSWPN